MISGIQLYIKSITRSLINFKKPRKMTNDFFNNLYVLFFFNFRFSGRKSQSQQNLAKKVTYFTIQFRSKNLTHFTNFNSLDIEKNMLSQHSQKPFSLYKCSSKPLVGVKKKTFALHHF